MTRRTGFNSPRRNREGDRPAVRTRGCGPRDAGSTPASPPTGAVSATAAGRSPEPEMPVQLGPAPQPWIPEGRTRGRRRPQAAINEAAHPNPCPRGPTRSGCRPVTAAVRVRIAAGALTDRWQKSDGLDRRSSRCRCESCPIHAAVAQGSSAPFVRERMPVRFRPAASGRVAQWTEHRTSKASDAGSTPAVSIAPVVYRIGSFRAKERDAVRLRAGALRARSSTGQSVCLRSSSMWVRLLPRPLPPGFGIRAETPKYPWHSRTCSHDAHGIVEPVGTSRVPSAASGVTGR